MLQPRFFSLTAANGPWIPPAAPSQRGPSLGPSPILGAVMVLIGLCMLAGGVWLVRECREEVREKRRFSRLIAGALTLDTAVKAGDILCIEGAVVGGQVVSDGPSPVYSEHLVIEDDRGRRVCLGVPGQHEVWMRYPAGQRVFAVGEVAQTGDPYRSGHEITLTNGEAGNFKVWCADREAALRDLQPTCDRYFEEDRW